MSNPKRPATRPQQASSSKRSKSSKLFHKADAQPFRFGHLPGEIRNQIYFLLLVDPDPISIKVKQGIGFDSQPYDEVAVHCDEDGVRLTSPTNHTIEAGILFVNSTIYDGAIPILYGQNTLKFHGAFPWNDFCLFNWNLRNTNSRHLSKVFIEFPEIERSFPGSGIIGEFNGSRACGIKMLKRLENLDTLRFSLFADLMTHDIGLLEKIRDNCMKAYQLRLQSKEVEENRRQGKVKNQGKDRGQAQDKGQCRIDLRIYKTEVPNAYGSIDSQAVRISSRAFESMQRWGWSIKGDFESIGQHHRFNNEEEWLQCLRKERNNRVQLGLISIAEDSLFFRAVHL